MPRTRRISRSAAGRNRRWGMRSRWRSRTPRSRACSARWSCTRQSAARNRMEWFEHVDRYVHLDPVQFSYTLLTGGQRIGHENLKLRDPQYVATVERRIAEQSGIPAREIPPMFTPFRIRGLTLKNRVVVSPMAMYSCRD